MAQYKNNRNRRQMNRKKNTENPFKNAKKRKQYQQEEILPKKFKGEEDLKNVEQPQYSSDESEDEQPADHYSHLLQSFGLATNSALDSDEEESGNDEQEEEDDSDEEESDDGELEERDGEGELENSEDEDSEFEEEIEEEEEDLGSDEESECKDDNMRDSSTEKNPVITIEKLKNEGSKEKHGGSLPQPNDPFCVHFEQEINDSALLRLKNPSLWSSNFQDWPLLGAVKCNFLKSPQGNSNSEQSNQQKVHLTMKKKKSLKETKQNEFRFGAIPIVPCLKSFNFSEYYVNDKITKNVNFTDYQKSLLASIVNYNDLYYAEATHDKYEQTTEVYCLHILNHVLKCRSRILHNNAKLKELQENKESIDFELFKDQGFVAPKVLILLPSRHSAYRVVMQFISLLGLQSSGGVEKLARFKTEYGPGDNVARKRSGKRVLPQDFIACFTGNTSDDFKIGISFKGHNRIKLYQNFLESDVILASPLALRVMAGVEGEQDTNADFLSSVEVLILDQADVFLMQNFEHVLTLLERINTFPQDRSQLKGGMQRVRGWMVKEHGHLYRQTIVFSAVCSTLHRHMMSTLQNYAGSMQVQSSSSAGVLDDCNEVAELMMWRVPATHDVEARFSFFVNDLLPRHVSSRKHYTLLYVPDYADYLHIAHHLSMERVLDFSSINEFMSHKESEVAVARSNFFAGKTQLLLYTERFHFYKRPVIKGIRHIIFYELPTYPHFFPELCNMMSITNQNLSATPEQMSMRSTVTVLFQRSDVLKMSLVFGNERTKELISSEKNIHVCTLAER